MSQADAHPCDLADLQGAWRREGRSLSGHAAEEVATVLWLQVGRYFCDLRTRWPQTTSRHMLDQAQAFSGTVVVRSGAISFHHDIDSLPRDPAHPDQGTVHRKDNVMFERGPGFEERWVAPLRRDDQVGVAELRGSGNASAPPVARLVRTGPIALVVWGGPTPGGAEYNEGDAWTRNRKLNDCADEGEVDTALFGMGTGQPLPEGWVLVDPGEV